MNIAKRRNVAQQNCIIRWLMDGSDDYMRILYNGRHNRIDSKVIICICIFETTVRQNKARDECLL